MINFENSPSTQTPLNAENLNKLQTDLQDEIRESQDNLKEEIAKTVESSIPQTITNENGTAIKFADGTMICNKRVIFNNIECTTASGTIYITAQLSLGNFAEEFTDIPVMTISKVRHDASWVYNTNQINKTNAGYVTFATTTARSSVTFECHLIAIGRWK